MIKNLKRKAYIYWLTAIIGFPIVICVLIGFAQAGILRVLKVEPKEEMFVTYVWARSMLEWRIEKLKDYDRGYKLIWRI